MSRGNPYIFDRPVEDPKAFVGRPDALAWVEGQLHDKRPEQTLWILGPPRFGKTSLLRQLRTRLAGRYILVEISAPSILAPRLGPSLARLAEAINQKLAEAEASPLEVPLPFDLQEDPTEFGQLYVPLLLQALHWPLLLALDDFCRPGLEVQQASARWVELGRYLGDLAAREPRLELLFAAERVPADWLEPRRRLLWRLGPLTQEEARRLLHELVAGELKYDYEAEERLLRVTAGQPYFLRLFAYTLFERCREQGRVRLRDVEDALLAAAPHAQPYLDYLRETSSPEAQAVWSCLGELRWGYGVILEREVHLLLQRKGPSLSARAVSAGVQELAERGVLEPLSSGAYRTQVEPVHTWLASQGRPEGARRARVLPAGRGRPWSLFWPLTAATIVVGLTLWSLASGGTGSLPEVVPSPTRSGPVIGAPLPTTPPRPRPAVVYMRLEEDSQTWEIYSMASDGSHPLRLTQNEINDSWPTWSWDGRYLAFVSERDGNREIYRMRPDDEQVTN
ncbi:MAG: PD40 domain-containing protein, partial [Chloroflexi bacterium]|nr:PD40 domain-containing protein [Chloroflexota bacterium]